MVLYFDAGLELLVLTDEIYFALSFYFADLLFQELRLSILEPSLLLLLRLGINKIEIIIMKNRLILEHPLEEPTHLLIIGHF